MNRHAKAPSAFTVGRKVALVLVLAAMSLLALAPAAFAGKVVDRFFPLAGASGGQGGQFNTPRDVAINQPTTTDGNGTEGWVYVADSSNHRIQAFNAFGAFQWALGRDVVGPGKAGNIALNEKQTVTLGANTTGGSFTLTWNGGTGNQVTAPIGWDASPAVVQGALEGLANLEVGDVSVTSPNPGGGVVGGPYTIEFTGTRGDVNVNQVTAQNTGLTVSGGSKSVTVATIVEGANSIEKCTVASDCKAGASGTLGGMFNSPQGVAINQSTGRFYVRDVSNMRVQEFEADGDFVGAWGWDTTVNGSASDPGNVTSFQICAVAAECKAGASGGNGGQFISGSVPGPGIAVSPLDGHVFVADPGSGVGLNGKRVNEFTAGGAYVKTWGWNVVPPARPGDLGEDALEVCPAAAAFTAGDCQTAPIGANGFANGQFASGSPTSLAVDAAGIVYASDSSTTGSIGGSHRVLRFDSTQTSLGSFLLSPITVAVQGGPLTAVTATNAMKINPADGHLLVSRGAGNVEDIANPGSATPTQAGIHLVGSGLTANGLDFNAAAGELYISSTTSSAHRVYVADDDGAGGTPPDVTLNPPSGITSHEASISGTMNPNGFPTSYRVQVSKNGNTWIDATADQNLGDGISPVPIDDVITGLEPNTLYRVRILATRGFGNSSVPSFELTFVTDSIAPDVSTDGAAPSDTTAQLLGRVNPNNLATTYHFEYGLTSSYGSQTAAVSAGSGTVEQGVAQSIGGLEQETTYHFRLVATNSEGTTFGEDKTFTTKAPVPGIGTRNFEMVTPPFKATRSVVGWGTPIGLNASTAVPSLDGNAVLWNTVFLPLSDDVGQPMAGDKRMIERTPDGWVNHTLNTLKSLPGFKPLATQLHTLATSGDLKTLAWANLQGSGGTFLPAEGIRSEPPVLAQRYYTRRDGTGVEGFSSWSTNVLTQQAEQGFISIFSSGGGDSALINDDGTAMARYGSYRGLADTPTDDTLDPSDDQQHSDGALYLVRSDDPDELPTAPKELVAECTGMSSEATMIPSRVGSGLPTDTIGSQSCAADDGTPLATGTGTLTDGSTTITSLSPESGAFSVGQVISGTGIPRGTIVTATGPGSLTLSASATTGAKGSGGIQNGSPTIEGAYTTIGAFAVGQTITGIGIPAGTTITAVDGSVLTLSANATASTDLATGTSLSTTGPASLPAQALTGTALRITSRAGATLGGSSSLSNDGHRIFFRSPPSATPGGGCGVGTGISTSCVPQLYVRQYDSSGEPTVRWISRAQGVGTQQVGELGSGVVFQRASRDGRYVYFSTDSPLLPNDPNGGNSITTGTASSNSWDLYRYELPADRDIDPAVGTLTRITAGSSGAADPNATHEDGASSTHFVSDDGRRAYFLTEGQMTGTDATPPSGGMTVPGGTASNGEGKRNLYLYDETSDSPTWRFVARLSSGRCATEEGNANAQMTGFGGTLEFEDGNCWHGTPDGSAVVFATNDRLTADDNDDAFDIYLYEAKSDELTRVSAPRNSSTPYVCKGSTGQDWVCNADFGFGPDGWANAAGSWETTRGWGGARYLNVSTDSHGVVSIYFESRAELLPGDTNGEHWDTYEWRNGELRLISPGHLDHDSFFSGNSLDGRDVFIFTSARIDPRELDDSDFDIYDARIGGGFPYTPPPEPCDVLAHECRGALSAEPEPRIAASASLTGAGNLKGGSAKAPKPCAKRQVRRKGKCVKRRSAKRAAKKTGRASR